MIVESVLVLSGLGLVFGIFLAYFSKKFHVEHDERIDKVRSGLPGYNCGACGYGSCDNYAKAVVEENVETNKCAPGGQDVAEKVAHIMGESVCEVEQKVAQLHCNGGKNNCGDRGEYKGVKTCRAASLIGVKKCSHGCIGFADCVLVCPVDAISMDNNDLPKVDKEKCIGCGKCVKVCPKKLYELVPKSKKVHVLCSSKDVGKDVVKVCKVGCIACFACEKACPSDAIHVRDNLAVLDYSKCTQAAMCVSVCPRKIIVDESKKE